MTDDSKIFLHPNIDELVTLAELAGIKGPGNTMKIIVELSAMNVPPSEVHQLLRDVIQSGRKKHSSKRSQVQENTSPKPPS